MRSIRHIASINDLSNDEIGAVFELALKYLDELGDPDIPHRIARSTEAANGVVLATVFFEPSTRTRLSFESAMNRLGGRVITSADPATSSTAKGESLADTVRVVSNYADLLVIRHPRDGAVRHAAEYAHVPVINAGDGGHEHPTQTLCDLFTLKQKNASLKGLNIAIAGDLRGSRTIHSFVYALARFGANLVLMPAKGMELPAHVDRRLREEFRCIMAKPPAGEEASNIDALYVTAKEPHQLSLIPENVDIHVKLTSRIDALYVTRFQKEREPGRNYGKYPNVDQEFLKDPRYSKASIMHPLPRVGELDNKLDDDSRAAYFEQASYGVPIRMALISLVMGLTKEKSLARFAGGFAPEKHPLYADPKREGVACRNANCITHDPLEQASIHPKFAIVPAPTSSKSVLRCHYCETDLDEVVLGDRKTKQLGDVTALQSMSAKELAGAVFFADLATAKAAGYS
ncbi:MAG: aspartate carbamoyltransferase catalytic subunit [Hyphomonadaceae bacterium]|nr:aspartate carbamoyltransferase catalytic subunit [Hyphomonadaceae bacterium]